ncbi:MAG: calcium-binding protein, partial [Rickettsiales bacterium]|nr:calcium-binding protein [Rickettsiales bacterium]
DGTVGWFDVITDQGTTSMNQPNTVVEVTSFHEAPPAPEFAKPESLSNDFREVMDFAPTGKYEHRENSETKESSEAETKQEAAPAEAPEAAVGEEHTPGAEPGEVDTETPNTPDAQTPDVPDAKTPDAAEVEIPDVINITMSGEEGNMSAFDQAQMTLDGQPDGMPIDGMDPNHHNDDMHETMLHHEEIIDDMMESLDDGEADDAMELADGLINTLEEQIEEDRNDLVESILSQPTETTNPDTPFPPTIPTSGDEGELTATGGIGGVGGPEVPVVGEEDGLDTETETEVETEITTTTTAVNNAVFMLGTSVSENFQGGGGNDLFIANGAGTILDVNDSLEGGTGTDTLKFTGAATIADLTVFSKDGSGNFDNISGIERIHLTQNTTLTIDQAFINQRDGNSPGIEVDFGTNTITADLQGLDHHGESGVMLNGTGMVDFAATTGGDFHQAINQTDVSVDFSLNTRGAGGYASGEFEFDGGNNTVVGASDVSQFLSIEQENGGDHFFTLSTGFNDIEFNNVTGTSFNVGDRGGLLFNAGSAKYLHLGIENSSYVRALVNVNDGFSNGMDMHIHNSDYIDITNNANGTQDFFSLSGSGTEISLDGNTGNDIYNLGNMYSGSSIDFTGSTTLFTYNGDVVHLNHLSGGANVELKYTGSGNGTDIFSNVDFNNISLNYADVNGDALADLELSLGGSTVVINNQDGTKLYNYREHGDNMIADLGLVVETDVRLLDDVQYQNTSNFNTSSSIASVYDDVLTANTQFAVVNSLDGDDHITVQDTGLAFDGIGVNSGGGNDTIIIEDSDIKFSVVDGGDGFNVLDLSRVNDGIAMPADYIHHVVNFSGTNITLTANTFTNGKIEGYKTDNSSAGNYRGDLVNSVTNIDAFIMGNAEDLVDLSNLAAGYVINGGEGGDTITGSSGEDTVTYATSSAGVTVDLALTGGTQQTSAGSDAHDDVLNSIENLVGSQHDDTLLGDTGDNELTGGNGNDTLDGIDGNNLFIGGAGNDIITGGTSAGIDTVSYEYANAGVTVDISGGGGGGGTAFGGNIGNDALTNIEHIIGSNHDDNLTGYNGLQIDGGHGNDIINLSLASDTDVIDGGFGFDSVKVGTMDATTLSANLSNIEAIDLSNGTTSESIDLTGLTAVQVTTMTGEETLSLMSDTGDIITLNASWIEGESDGGYTTYNNSGVELAIADTNIV